MTLAEIEAMEGNVLTVKQVAEFLGMDPQLIRDQAARDPKFLGYAITNAGHSWKIPRLAFIAWVKGQVPQIACYSEMKEDGFVIHVPMAR